MLKQVEFQARRHQLLQQITPNSIVIVAANQECPRNGDANYRFRQNSNFYYLTGFEEPDAVMVLSKGEDTSPYTLFNRAKNKEQEIWHGIRAGQQDDSVCFTVWDTGIGIPKEKMNRIFDRFYQVEPSLARHYEGMGLGLSIVKAMVELHHGRIQVRSKEGQGSAFTVTIPLRHPGTK